MLCGCSAEEVDALSIGLEERNNDYFSSTNFFAQGLLGTVQDCVRACWAEQPQMARGRQKPGATARSSLGTRQPCHVASGA